MKNNSLYYHLVPSSLGHRAAPGTLHHRAAQEVHQAALLALAGLVGQATE
jgi:hypothetical protein